MATQPNLVAIVYQAAHSPAINGILKPMKPGGYADSGADIAYCLREHGHATITPVPNPAINNDLDWVFPDTHSGILKALELGANCIWLNTVLYASHPIMDFCSKGLRIIGQVPALAEKFDDKWTTNNLLRENGLPVPVSELITAEDRGRELSMPFPLVAKPIRGRGSQGVTVIHSPGDYSNVLNRIFDSAQYGTAIYLEEYLPGQEVTITVMPPGNYQFPQGLKSKNAYWSLPVVKRFNHYDGVAPYSGTVAIIHNSTVLDPEESMSAAIRILSSECEKAAGLVGAMAPIRIDCRADASGHYQLFDLNMKPNMTGASRPHRPDQDSLTALAARQIGWNYYELLQNMILQAWSL